VIFRVFFAPSKQFLDFLELFLALKINSKKRKPILPDWAEPVGPTLRAGPASRPPEAHRGPAEPARPVKVAAFTAGSATTPASVPRRRVRAYLRRGRVSSRALARRPCPVPAPPELARPPPRFVAAAVSRSKPPSPGVAQHRAESAGHLPVANQSPEHRRHLAPPSAAAKVCRRPPCRPLRPW
jgi:hypothetical protein